METDLMQLLMQLPPDKLEAMFRDYGQEQGVLDQQMGLASDMRKPGPEHSTPWGALLGGLSNAVGNVGGAYMQGKNLEAQGALGAAKSKDAAGRFKMLGQMSDEQMKQQALWDALGLSPAAML